MKRSTHFGLSDVFFNNEKINIQKDKQCFPNAKNTCISFIALNLKLDGMSVDKERQILFKYKSFTHFLLSFFTGKSGSSHLTLTKKVNECISQNVRLFL